MVAMTPGTVFALGLMAGVLLTVNPLVLTFVLTWGWR